jgi:peptidyl-prolyl cis-trans isomerase A (cyclophilin A)
MKAKCFFIVILLSMLSLLCSCKAQSQASDAEIVFDQVPADPSDPVVRIETSMGDIYVELYMRLAPRSASNFLGLALGQKEFLDVRTGKSTNRRFYDNLLFFRIRKNMYIQSGCPLNNGFGGPGYALKDECNPSLFHQEGSVGYVYHGPDRNGSQFYILLEPIPALDGVCTIFGQVVKGLDVARAIGSQEVVGQEIPIYPVSILSISLFRDGK